MAAVCQAPHSSSSQTFAAQHFGPVFEEQVRGNNDVVAFVRSADHIEQKFGANLAGWHVTQFVEHKQVQLCKLSLAADRVGLHREQPTLIVIQQKLLLAELLQERLDLSVLELDLLLSFVHNAAKRSDQDVPGLEQERHVRRRNWPVSGSHR